MLKHKENKRQINCLHSILSPKTFRIEIYHLTVFSTLLFGWWGKWLCVHMCSSESWETNFCCVPSDTLHALLELVLKACPLIGEAHSSELTCASHPVVHGRQALMPGLLMPLLWHCTALIFLVLSKILIVHLACFHFFFPLFHPNGFSFSLSEGCYRLHTLFIVKKLSENRPFFPQNSFPLSHSKWNLNET